MASGPHAEAGSHSVVNDSFSLYVPLSRIFLKHS